MTRSEDSTRSKSDETGGPRSTAASEPRYVKVTDIRPIGDEDTCLRPLGLCELGGCCDACWYRPNHPRFQR